MGVSDYPRSAVKGTDCARPYEGKGEESGLTERKQLLLFNFNYAPVSSF